MAANFRNLPKPETSGETYYDKELTRIGTAAVIKVMGTEGKDAETRWMTVNEESAGAIRRFLARLGL